MPICIECCHPVPQLYHVLHGNKPASQAPAATPVSASASASAASTSNPSPNLSASTSSSPTKHKSKLPPTPKPNPKVSDVRLTQCPHCKKFADKYVEHDFVVLFIDLVLVKPQVNITPPITPSPHPHPKHHPQHPAHSLANIISHIAGLPPPPNQPALTPLIFLLQNPPLQPLQPLHNPPRHSPNLIRRLPHLVAH